MDDYFELFSLPKVFNIDMSFLESKYIRACTSSHPDHLHDNKAFFISAAEMSLSKLNDAYQTLKNPISRAEHLLILLGGFADHESKQVPECFLEEIIDLREKLADATKLSDRNQLEGIINHKIEQSKNRLALLFTPPLNSEKKKSLRELLNQIAYLQSIEREFLQQEE